MPKFIAEARRLDRENENMLWEDAIDKEMKNKAIAFDIRHHQALGKPASTPVGYKKSGVHMRFDVKFNAGFTGKAQLVADGHNQDEPYSMTYLSVVSCNSVRIMLTLAELKNLDLQTADAQNSYLNAKPK